MIDGVAVPAELLDGDHPVWRDRFLYRAWLAGHGLSRVTISDRMGRDGSPGNRRNVAAEEWAERHRVLLDPRLPVPRASWPKLRAAGLID